MKATELRIGNLLRSRDKIVQINQIAKTEGIKRDYIVFYYVPETGYYSIYHLSECRPITLTEDWLLRFGFAEDKERGIWVKDFNITGESGVFQFISFANNGKFTACYTSGSMISSRSIKYVHQLQNIYFALVGEELQIQNEKEAINDR